MIADSDRLQHIPVSALRDPAPQCYAGTAAGGINMQQCGNTASQVGELEQIDKQLNASLETMYETLCRVRWLGDRLFGTQPEAVGKGGKELDPNSQISRLQQVSGFISVSLDELRSQIARLERL